MAVKKKIGDLTLREIYDFVENVCPEIDCGKCEVEPFECDVLVDIRNSDLDTEIELKEEE